MRYSNVLLRLNIEPSFWWLLIVLSLFTPLAGANPAALTWLDIQLQAGGSYERPDDIATPTQATAETLRTLHALNSVDTPVRHRLLFSIPLPLSPSPNTWRAASSPTAKPAPAPLPIY